MNKLWIVTRPQYQLTVLDMIGIEAHNQNPEGWDLT